MKEVGNGVQKGLCPSCHNFGGSVCSLTLQPLSRSDPSSSGLCERPGVCARGAQTEKPGSQEGCARSSVPYHGRRVLLALVLTASEQLAGALRQMPSHLWYPDLAKGFAGSSVVKASACQEGDMGLIPGSGRSAGEGNGSPLPYSCLENPMGYSPWGSKESDVPE